MINSLSKSMILDGIAASEAIDSSGEILEIKGLDITSLQDGSSVLNYEHRSDQSEGASANDIIGSIIFAKKIFGPKDCENDRELKYWNKVQLPFVYIQAELFDGEGHPGAAAAAALIRYYQRRKLPILMRYSIEGSTLDRDPNNKNILKRAIARRVAATIKPCNRSCISGVLSDSQETPTKEVSKEALAELIRHEDPNKIILSSYEGEFEPIVSDPFEKLKAALEGLHEVNEFNKALSAGGYNAMPTSLTGGSALQVESFDEKKKKKYLQNQAMGAMRDWRGRGDIKKFLKHRMPDASESFIEHFANLVNDYQVKKMVYLEDNLIKAVSGSKELKTHQAKVKSSQSEEVENLPEEKIGDAPLTVRGRTVRSLPALDSTHFDERKGTLYTPRGAFKMYLPQNDKTPGALESFYNILNDPKVTAFHDYATSNWLKVHKMAREGRLPPEIIMHSTLFSQLSPNTAVPMQELMYSHLVDSMKQHGIDARDPKFQQLKEDWQGRDQPSNFPEHAGEYFKGPMRAGITISGRKLVERAKQLGASGTDPFAVDFAAKPSQLGGRFPGELQSFMLGESKFKNMAQYHRLHEQLVDLFNHHRHDARSLVGELMQHKYQSRLHDAARRRHMEAGKPDPGEYGGPDVPGLAPKTGRYMAAMAGGGNIHVPDTHFSRYLFGLEKGTDARTIAYLKNVLWGQNNSHILEAIDRFYAKNHPAVQHMMEHPVFGKHFVDREDAIFPAFWKNWVAIAPHERFRKMKTMAYNEATDHRPFWEAIQPFVKSEDNHLTLPLNTARTHAKWVEEHGEIPAMMLYYAHIVPQLLRASRGNESIIVKMDKIKNDLVKAVDQMNALPQIPKQDMSGIHEFNGKSVIPGEIEISSGPYKGSKMHYLGKDKTGAHYVKPKEGADVGVRRLSATNEGKGFKILNHPQEAHVPNWVDANLHSDPLNNRHSQNLLFHGIDLNNPSGPAAPGTATSSVERTGWYRNLSGQLTYVKPNTTQLTDWEDPDQQYSTAQYSFPSAYRELMYKNMANDFFGLGHVVPETATFNHPDLKDGPASLQGKIIGAEHFDRANPTHKQILQALHENGDLDKYALMDMAQGNNDRHINNFMLTPREFVTSGSPSRALNFHDNGLSLDYKKSAATDIWNAHSRDNLPINNNVRDWFLSLSPEEFTRQQLNHKVPENIAKHGYNNFREMQLAMMDDKLNNRETYREDLRSIAELRAEVMMEDAVNKGLVRPL